MSKFKLTLEREVSKMMSHRRAATTNLASLNIFYFLQHRETRRVKT